jgi:hypothetical protein
METTKGRLEPSLTGYADVNGLHMYYDLYGEGSPLVLLHGGMLTIDLNFATLIPALAREHQLIGIEMQGHGRTLSASGLTGSMGRAGACLGQRPFRVFLLNQRRTARPSGLAHPGHGQAGHHRVHRLVQRHPATQHPRLPQPRRIRETQQDQEGSLTLPHVLSTGTCC